jgi:Flp pilus assembly protein TadD
MTANTCSAHTIPEKTDEYKQALQMAEEGKTQEALVCLQEYLASAPNDPEALNDTGAILFSLGHNDEAVNHLEKAMEICPDSAEIVWNLAEIRLADNKAEQAMDLFDDMEKMGILNAEVLNRTADVLLQNENFSDAVKVLRRSLEMSPNQEILNPMIETISAKIPKKTD